jgi:hypothetical protein
MDGDVFIGGHLKLAPFSIAVIAADVIVGSHVAERQMFPIDIHALKIDIMAEIANRLKLLLNTQIL